MDNSCRPDVQQHHASLRVIESGLVDAAKPLDRSLDDAQRVGGRSQQANGRRVGVLLALREGTGVNEHENLPRRAGLLPEFLRRPAREEADRFDDGRQVGDPPSEAPGAGDLLFCGWRVIETDAGLPLQFPDCPFQDDGPAPANKRRLHPRKVQSGRDADGFQLRPDSPADAPNLAHSRRRENGVEVRRRQCGKVADVAEFLRITSGFSDGGFGDVVSEFGERLGRSDANACGKSEPVLKTVPDGVRASHEVSPDAFEIDEAFVDGVDFLIRSERGGYAHEAAAHVAVKNEIGGDGDHACVGELPPKLEVRVSHLDSERLRLVTSGDGAAVVVAQHDDGTPFQ